MARPKKDHQSISIRLEQEVYDRLNQFVADSGQSKTTAVERALTMYMDDYYERQRIIDDVKRD